MLKGMHQEAERLLRLAGWFPGRRVETGAVEQLAARGHLVSPAAVELLTEFAGLTVGEPDQSLWVDGQRAADDCDPAWCAAYGIEVGRTLTPFGAYSHMSLLVDDRGGIWGGFDAEYGYLGDSLASVVEALVVTSTGRLDRRLN